MAVIVPDELPVRQPARASTANYGPAPVDALAEPRSCSASCRSGRHFRDLLARLGAAIAAVLDEELSWPCSRTIVEFTQHAGDEFWRADGLSQDWVPGEAQ